MHWMPQGAAQASLNVSIIFAHRFDDDRSISLRFALNRSHVKPPRRGGTRAEILSASWHDLMPRKRRALTERCASDSSPKTSASSAHASAQREPSCQLQVVRRVSPAFLRRRRTDCRQNERRLEASARVASAFVIRPCVSARGLVPRPSSGAVARFLPGVRHVASHRSDTSRAR